MQGITVIRSGQWTAAASRPTYEIEGREFGAPLTFILESLPTGRGPKLHRHPYDELWVCQAGEAEFTDGVETINIGPGDIVYAPAGTSHKFQPVGKTLLKMVCIHCSPTFTTEWIEN